MKILIYYSLILCASCFANASDWQQLKLSRFALDASNLEDAVKELSDSVASLSEDQNSIDYITLPKSVSYSINVSSADYGALVDQLLGRGLREINEIEKTQRFEDTKITVNLREVTAKQVASYLFEYHGSDYNVSSNTLIFQKKYEIRIDQIKVSGNMMAMLQQKKAGLPFDRNMFLLVPNDNVILVASFSSIDLQLQEIREMDEVLKQVERGSGKTPNPFEAVTP